MPGTHAPRYLCARLVRFYEDLGVRLPGATHLPFEAICIERGSDGLTVGGEVAAARGNH